MINKFDCKVFIDVFGRVGLIEKRKDDGPENDFINELLYSFFVEYNCHGDIYTEHSSGVYTCEFEVIVENESYYDNDPDIYLQINKLQVLLCWL